MNNIFRIERRNLTFDLLDVGFAICCCSNVGGAELPNWLFFPAADDGFSLEGVGVLPFSWEDLSWFLLADPS